MLKNNRKLLAILLIVLTLLTIVGIIATRNRPGIAILIGCCAFSFVIAYFLNHKGKTLLALTLTVGSLTVLPFAVVLLFPPSTQDSLFSTVSWLILPILFSSLFAPPRQTAFLFVLILSLLIALVLWEPNMTLSMAARSVGLMISISSLLLIFSSRYQQTSTKQNQLALLVENAADFIGYAKSNGQVFYINPAGLNMVGMGRDEPYGHLFLTDFHPPWIAERLSKEIVPTVIAKGFWQGELVLRHRDGSEIPVSVVAIAHFSPSGKVEMISTIMRNITQEKQSEQALKDSETKWRTLVSSIKEAIFIHQFESGKILEANPKACEIFGYSEQEFQQLKGRNLHPPGEKEAIDRFSEQINSQSHAYTPQIRMLKKDGTIFWGDMRATVYCVGEQNLIVSILRDISERVNLEQQRILALQHEKELNEMKTNFISMISHEFRTPLATILAASNVLKRYDQKLTEAEKTERHHKIETEIEHMIRMLEDVLLIGKMDVGQLAFHPQEVDLKALCQEIAQDVDKEKRIQIKIGNIPPKSWLDKQLLRHILNNLLTNALKYSTPENPVSFRVDRQGQYICFQIKDKSMGIPEAEIEYLFEPFYRAKNVAEVPGTGLGLTIVKQCVDLHGGRIEVKSKINQGSTFSVWLPINEEKYENHFSD